ncbi:MAG: chemotaxis protein CheW [bacterium]|nr:chemotaxis protein CheW [bacterium]
MRAQSADRAHEEIQQKYLTFMLGEEEYGVPVLQVAEIVKVENLIRIPHARQYFLGLMDIRGRVLPIVDLKLKLSIQTQDEQNPQAAAATSNTSLDRAIIIEIQGRRIGLAVDQVSHVVRFPPENIDPGPPSLKTAASKFVTGVGKNDEEFVVLMNLNHLFSEEELSGLFSGAASAFTKK